MIEDYTCRRSARNKNLTVDNETTTGVGFRLEVLVEEEEVVVATRMPLSLCERLDDAAARDQRTRASAIRAAVAEWVQRAETQRPKGVTP